MIKFGIILNQFPAASPYTNIPSPKMNQFLQVKDKITDNL